MLAACFTVLCLTQSVAETAPVDGLIERTDRIVIARVAALHPLKGAALQLVELALEQEVYAAGDERLFAFPYATKYSKVPDALELGQSYVLFLELWPGSPFSKTQAKAVEPLLQSAPLYSWSAVWSVHEERVTVPPAALPLADRPSGVTPGPNGDDVPRKELIDWLAQRIEASLPSIRVVFSGTGPSGPMVWFTVGPHGSVQGKGASTANLGRDRLQHLWDEIARERFDELPERVGAASSVCPPIGSIEIRRRDGMKKVFIHGSALERVPAAERDAAERALRIWRALPIARATFGEPQK